VKLEHCETDILPPASLFGECRMSVFAQGSAIRALSSRRVFDDGTT